MKVAVIGSGSWGTALALKSIEANNDTFLYCRRSEMAEALKKSRENSAYLKGVKLPESLHITASKEEAIHEANIILMVTPSVYVRSTLHDLAPLIPDDAIVVLCSKGIERGTGKLLLQVIGEELGARTDRIAILSGPNHAEEIGRNLPAATVVASPNIEVAKTLQKTLNSSHFRVYINDDYIGIELAAATKNVIALAAGIADGLNLGDNTKATLLTRGLHEMTKFGVKLGAKRETYAGLAGMGDLIATCMSQHSRNRAAGQHLADGKTMDYIINHTNMVVEGFYAVAIVHDMALKNGVDMPITNALYDVLYHEKKPIDAIKHLMEREMKVESIL